MKENVNLFKLDKTASRYSVPDFLMHLGASLNHDGIYISQQQLENVFNKALTTVQSNSKDPESITCAFAIYADFVSILGETIGFLNVKDNDEAWLTGLPLVKAYLTSFKIAVVEALSSKPADEALCEFTAHDVVDYMLKYKVGEKEAIASLRRKSIKIIH